MNHDRVAVYFAKRAKLIGLEGLHRARMHLGHIARCMNGAVEAHHSA